PSQPTAGSPFHRLLAPRAGAWWRLLLSAALGVAGLVVMSTLCAIAVLLVARQVGFPDFEFDFSDGIDAGEMLATNAGLACLIAVAAGLARLLYGVRLRWLSSNRPGLRWSWLATCIAIAAVVWSLFLVVGSAGAYLNRSTPVDAGVLSFLLVVLATTPLQAAGEEYLFRGLLLQGLGAVRLPTWACCLGSGALFATAHLQFAPALFADRLLLGAVLAWLAIRTGGLEAGIAIHTVKNVAVLIPAGLLETVNDALDPTGVTWLPLIIDGVLLSIAVPWIVRVSTRRAPRAPALLPVPPYPPPPSGGALRP
ncbi:MAG: CPBP family intramembrane metalloprotease, partial [Propionibacteriales bacterium]|nr:CPBP family intramembrane metalloprotease [Propionibacteriales bacterium]